MAQKIIQMQMRHLQKKMYILILKTYFQIAKVLSF